MNWISVKDKLPENLDEILFSDGRFVLMEYLLKNKDQEFWFSSTDQYIMDQYIHGVTHWMELPKLPREL